MNAYQRVMAAIAFQPVDKVPACPFVMAFAARFAGVPYGRYCTDYRAMARAQVACVEHFGYDIVTADTDAYREAQACGAELEFPADDLPVEKKPALPERKDLAGLALPDVYKAERLADKIAGVQELKKQTGGQIPVLGWVEAPFQSAAILRGLNNFMMDLYDAPDFVAELLDFTAGLAVAFGRAQVEAGADIIGMGDAIASLVSLSMYRQWVLPCTQRVVQGLKATGVKVKYHICGASQHLLEAIGEMDFDIINIDARVDLAEARKVFRDKCVKGNIDPSAVLLQGTPEEVAAAARRCMAIGGRGYLLSPGCEVPRQTPEANFAALVRAREEWQP
ncbi:uroporphyrinogen decarboxylase family protein [Moorella sulfitireducens (nom. illeg.)]|uniref:uroporphyrinogen decarboxylase family protein n=1 Tax=Neomoorella sulfitireducens TaxID=2972948 RepID=UPI0021ABC354|nr:uroporphyrinogen decarboxylase family protein [Moorella sulfitireducens]